MSGRTVEYLKKFVTLLSPYRSSFQQVSINRSNAK